MDRKVNLKMNTLQAFNNISIVECGLQPSDSAAREGPLHKTEFVLQYVISGEGYYRIHDKEHHVLSGDLFYLPKNVLLSYWPDSHAPYSYWWLGFDGQRVELLLERIGFTPDTPVIHCSDETIRALFSSIFSALQKNSVVSLTKAHGQFYDLLSLLLSVNPENDRPIRADKSQYAKRAMTYITHNYATDLTVAQVAKHLSLNRMYFSTLFKEETGNTPMQFLLSFRVNQACKLLLNSDDSITSISQQCGFKSPSNFSVQFKSITGYSPLQYRTAKRNAIQNSEIDADIPSRA